MPLSLQRLARLTQVPIRPIFIVKASPELMSVYFVDCIASKASLVINSTVCRRSAATIVELAICLSYAASLGLCSAHTHSALESHDLRDVQ